MAKILLVEDDNNLREIFAMRLKSEGHEVSTAGDGEEALAVAVKEKPDLIVADIMMPRLSGFEMLENLRAAPDIQKTKVIMMTALGQAEDRARGERLGVVKYLVKSQVTLEDFVRVVREVMQPNNKSSNQVRSSTMDEPTNQPTSGSDPAMPQPAGEPTSPPAMPDTPAPAQPGGDSSDTGAGVSSNPISGGSPTMPTGGADPLSTNDEKADVASQINNFASSPVPGSTDTGGSTLPPMPEPKPDDNPPAATPPTTPGGSPGGPASPAPGSVVDPDNVAL